MSPHDREDYSPDHIRYWLSGGRCARGQCNWAMLESAVEGGTGSAGLGSGRGERFGLTNLKADMETAADRLPLHWQATRLVFSRQHRYSVWLARWQAAGKPTDNTDQEPADLPAAFELAIWRMARTLGCDDQAAA